MTLKVMKDYALMVKEEVRHLPIRAFEGKYPKLDPTVLVDPTATIIGDVEIGAESSVWPGAVIRGDRAKIRIGRMCSIQDNAVLHGQPNTPVNVGDKVTVGHGAILHGCTIHEECLIGLGTIILNRADVGSQSIIGAGALVLEDQKIPERSMAVGVPAKVIKTAGEEELKAIRTYYMDYIGLAKRHRENLSKL